MKKYFLLAALLGFVGQACAMQGKLPDLVPETQGSAGARGQAAPEEGGNRAAQTVRQRISPQDCLETIGRDKINSNLKNILNNKNYPIVQVEESRGGFFIFQKGKNGNPVSYFISKKDGKWDFSTSSMGPKEVLKNLQGK